MHSPLQWKTNLSILGLSIVKNITQVNGYDLSVDYQENEREHIYCCDTVE
ncbi:hypothetical protein [Aliivibrio finisterrensis]|nr:hypothetical protein [Aliivibrio finisterrensis]